MVNIIQIGTSIYHLSIALGIALIIITTSALNMIEKKRLGIFMPFFIFGLGLCLFAGFMFYGFFGVAIDVFYTISFVASTGIFFILWRQTK